MVVALYGCEAQQIEKELVFEFRLKERNVKSFNLSINNRVIGNDTIDFKSQRTRIFTYKYQPEYNNVYDFKMQSTSLTKGDTFIIKGYQKQEYKYVLDTTSVIRWKFVY